SFGNDTAAPKQEDSGSAHARHDDEGGAGNIGEGMTSGQRAASSGDGSGQDSGEASGDQASNGGVAHGIGADPDTLFGPSSAPKIGGQGFEISIDARSESKGPKAAGNGYLPPKVRTPLNAEQHPDEP